VQTDISGAATSYVVAVKSATGHRGVYRLTATWTDAVWVGLARCLQEKVNQRVAKVHTKPPFLTHPNVLLGDPPPDGERAAALLGPLGGFNPVLAGSAGSIDVALAGPDGVPLHGLLFNSDGVLVGDSEPLSPAAAAAATRPDGLVPTARLTAGGLEPGEQLYLVAEPTGQTAVSTWNSVGFGAP
jgi:hypothetical protein